MTLRKIAHHALAGAVLLAPISAEAAADEDDLNERVSAAACQPRVSADRSKISWTGTEWIFAGTQVGEVILECPIYTPFEDQDTGTRTVEEIRIWYQDSDGTSTNARVDADLRFVSGTSGSLTSISEGSVSSNGSATTSLTRRAVALNVSMDDGQYFVVVTLFRQSSSETVRFRGVTFLQAP